MTQDNIKRIGNVCQAISESISEAVNGNKTYDFRTPIEQVSVAIDDEDPKLLMVNIQCRGMHNQTFSISLHEDKDADTPG